MYEKLGFSAYSRVSSRARSNAGMGGRGGRDRTSGWHSKPAADVANFFAMRRVFGRSDKEKSNSALRIDWSSSPNGALLW